MSSMEFDQFKTRLSKFQRPADTEVLILERENYAVNLRKSKRVNKHQKFRTSKINPLCANISEDILKKFPAFCSQNLEESFLVFKQLLNDKGQLLETLQYLRLFLHRLDENEECVCLFFDLVDAIGEDALCNATCFECMIEISYLASIPRFMREDIIKIFGEFKGVDKFPKTILFYNLLKDSKLEENELNLMIDGIFTTPIEERAWQSTLEIIHELLSSHSENINFQPGLNWLLQIGIKHDFLRTTSLELIASILKKIPSIDFKPFENLSNILLDIIATDACNTKNGLKILYYILIKYRRSKEIKSIDTKNLINLIECPDYQIKRYAFQILRLKLGKVEVGEMISEIQIKNLITDFLNSDTKVRLQAFKLAHFFLYFFKFTLIFFLRNQVFETLSNFTETTPKLTKYFILVCFTLIEIDSSLVSEFEQNNLIEVIETMEYWNDPNIKDIYEDLLSLKSGDPTSQSDSIKTFIFS